MLKLGFVGGGLNSVAGYTHFVASRMDGRFRVVSGIFSRNSEINKKTALYWSVERVYESIHSFIEAEKNLIDAVVVLLPTPDHFSCVKAAIDAGLPVICEKPLFYTYDEIRRFAEEKKDNHFIVVTYNYIGYPILWELKNIIATGGLGRILNVHLEMPQESFLRPPRSVDYPPGWRKVDGPIPGIILDLFSHLFSIFQYLLGDFLRIEKVRSFMRRFSKYKVVDEVKAFMECDNDTAVFAWVSKVAIGSRNGMRIAVYGDEGSALWVQENPEKLILNDTKGKSYVIDRGVDGLSISKDRIVNRMTPGHPAGFIEAFANIYYVIYEALLNFIDGKSWQNSPLLWTLDKEEENFKVMKAITESALSNRDIYLDKI